MMRDVDDPGMVNTASAGAQPASPRPGWPRWATPASPPCWRFPEFQEWANDIGRTYHMVEGVALEAGALVACCGWAHVAR